MTQQKRAKKRTITLTDGAWMVLSALADENKIFGKETCNRATCVRSLLRRGFAVRVKDVRKQLYHYAQEIKITAAGRKALDMHP